MKWARNAIWEVRKCNRMEKLPSSGLSRAQNISVRLRRRFKAFLEGCKTQCKKKERKKKKEMKKKEKMGKCTAKKKPKK